LNQELGKNKILSKERSNDDYSSSTFDGEEESSIDSKYKHAKSREDSKEKPYDKAGTK
jgi:hypothetical protein